MSDGVKVDLNALTTFAGALGRAADGHFASDSADGANMTGVAKVMKMSTKAQDPPKDMCIARNGFLEAQDFATRHQAMAESAQAFVNDALKGVVTLAAAAETCAVRYAGTDAANAALLRKIDKEHVFTSLAPPVTGTGTVTSGAVLDAFTPGKDQALFPEESAGSGTTAAGTTVTTQAPTDKAFDAEIEKKRQALANGQNIDEQPIKDPGEGTTVGAQPNALVVPADSVKIPVKPEIPVTPQTAR
jgi:hypothetical protein